MTNPLFILDTYPYQKREIDILNRCIDSIKVMGFDILIVSHHPLDEATTKKVNYTIYDYDNTFLPSKISPYSFLNTNNISVKFFNGGHALPICRNMRTSINMAKCLGYETFIFTESDVIFHIDDLKYLHSITNTLVENNKSMFFFRPEEYKVNNSYVYETLLFGGKTDYFIETFNPPLNLSDWIEKSMGFTLELSFYERFSHDEHKFIIINDHSSVILSNSEVNISRYGLFNCEVIATKDNVPILFIFNSLIDEPLKYIDLYVNDVVSYHILGKNQYWYNSYKLDNSKIDVYVYEDEAKSILYLHKTFILTENNNFNLKGIYEDLPSNI